MPRTPRKKSGTGIYHVMLRGADRRIIFSDDEDCSRFLETMKRAKRESGFRLFAWCLMGNHVGRQGDGSFVLTGREMDDMMEKRSVIICPGCRAKSQAQGSTT